MTMDVVDRITKVLEGVPKAPWRACGEDRGGCQCGIVWAANEETPIVCVSSGIEDAPRLTENGVKAVSLFIAAARELLPEAATELQQLRAELRVARDALDTRAKVTLPAESEALY